MTLSQRQAVFDRYLAEISKAFAKRLKIDYVCTVRRMPPPPFPGETAGEILYYVNGGVRGKPERKLVEFTRPMYAVVRKGQAWAESGKGKSPSLEK